MEDLIELLANASTAVSSAAGRASGETMRRRLLICALDLRNLAIALRRGEVEVPDTANGACAKELRDAIAAAKAAKTEDGFGGLLAEALQAVDTVEQHLVAKTDPLLSAAMNLSARGPSAGMTPLPPDLLPPRWPRWPRRPMGWPPHLPWPPPRPWPWPPEPPWWDEIPGWGRGFRD